MVQIIKTNPYTKEQEIIKSRIHFLLENAERYFKMDSQLSRTLLLTAKKLSIQYRIEFPKNIENQMCPKCCTIFIPTLDSHTEVKNISDKQHSDYCNVLERKCSFCDYVWTTNGISKKDRQNMIKNKKEEKKNSKIESPIVSPVINKPEIKTTQVKQNRFSFTSAITSPTPSPRTTSNNNPKNMLLETKKTTNKKKKKSLTKQVLEQSKQLSPMSASSVSSWRSSLSR